VQNLNSSPWHLAGSVHDVELAEPTAAVVVQCMRMIERGGVPG
jgi:hypothetical protein